MRHARAGSDIEAVKFLSDPQADRRRVCAEPRVHQNHDHSTTGLIQPVRLVSFVGYLTKIHIQMKNTKENTADLILRRLSLVQQP